MSQQQPPVAWKTPRSASFDAKAPASGRSSRRSTESSNITLSHARSSESSTIAPSHCTQSSSEFSVNEVGGSTAILWDELAFGGHMQPFRRYASCSDDIYLLSAFLRLAEVPDIDGSSVKLLLRSLKFLRRCNYSVVDICSILAHASIYFLDVFKLCGGCMDAAEVGNILVTVMFLAHSYIQDETCPLHVWHQYLFRGYCPLKKLSEAVMRVMAIRKYVLRLQEKELRSRLEVLENALSVPPAEKVC